MLWILFLASFLSLFSTVSTRQYSTKELENYQNDPFSKDINLIVELAAKQQFEEAANLAIEILQVEPKHFDANQLYGSILLNLRRYEDSVKYFERSFAITMPEDLAMYRNYIEALRWAGRIDLARVNAARILETLGKKKRHATDAPFLLAYARVELDMGDASRAIQLAEEAVNLDPSSLTAWLILMEILTSSGNFIAAENLAYQYLEHFSLNADILSRLGIALQFQRRLSEALAAFKQAERLAPESPFILSCLAAVHQELGNSVDAYYYFERSIPLLPDDASVRNNFGALLGSMGFQKEELYWLKEAVKFSPSLPQANMNLAGYYQDEGNISMAVHYFNMIPDGNDEKVNIDIRMATMLKPISLSWDEMSDDRNRMKNAYLAILRGPQVNSSCDGSLDRLPFYVSFHGLNDRPLQDLLGKVYRYRLKEVGWYSPLLQNNNFVQNQLTHESRSLSQLLPDAPSVSVSVSLPSFVPRKLRVGFISKFFGVFEPHGLLLDGMMKYLPRSQFHVVCLFVARTDFKVVASRIQEACDEHHQLSLTIPHVVEVMNSVVLDALLFADVLSEPINHFLTHMRFAPIQIAFWGNPITTGSQTIDYFLSADIMEHPFRTRIPKGDDAYSEQVWLMEGQGIWYFKPVDPNIEIEKANMSHLVGKTKNFTRADFDLPEKSSNVFLYLLPQSTFKIHPLYDLVLREILAKDERIHIAVTGGRRPSWTARYLHRLRYNLGEEYAKRLHVIERVSSENFYSLISLADGILHPFPFDGSRTSADALQEIIPFVTLPTEYLRGRMGFSFYRTMNISELVAVDVQEYVDIAVKLASDESFYRDMKIRIRERVELIWEDMTVPYHATQFLQRVFSLPISRSYETYLRVDSGRYENNGQSNVLIDPVAEDLGKSKLRERYQSAFDSIYGDRQRRRRKYTYAVINSKKINDEHPLNGAWELDDETHIASLEGFSEGKWPRVFEHWRKLRIAEQRPLHVPPIDRIPPVPSHVNMSERINPFPLKIKPRNSPSAVAASVVEETAGNQSKELGQPVSPKSSEQLTSPGKIQVEEEKNLLTDSYAAASLLKTNSPAESIDIPVAFSLSAEGTSPIREQEEYQNISPSHKDRFYSYGIIANSDRAKLAIEEMQLFRRLMRRGNYNDALHVLSNLEKNGYSLPFHDAVFHIEKGMIHLFREEFPLALQHCRTAHALNSLMVNALGCIGVALTYSPEKEERREGSQYLLQALELHEKVLLEALQDMKQQYPLETNEQFLAEKIDDRVVSASGMSVVSMPLDSLLFSFVASLVNLEEYELCTNIMVQFFNLPVIEKGGSHIVVMAQIAWSKLGERIVEESFPHDIEVMKHVRYLQKHASLLLSNFGLCLSMSKYGDLYASAFKDVVRILEKIHKQHDYFALREFSLRSSTSRDISPQQLPLIRAMDKSPAAVTVLTQYFRASSADTQKVLDYVLYKNLANPAVDEVHLLTEEDFTKDLVDRFPTNLLLKVRQKVIGKRLTFAMAFEYANHFLADRLVALTNADIYFDESLYRVLYASQHLNLSASVFSSENILASSLEDISWSKKQKWQYRSFPSNTVLALLRWQQQYNTQGDISLALRTDSQDAWIFRPPLDERLLSLSNFPLGVPRCDNRLVYLLKALNYTVLNPAFEIHAIEYQTLTSGNRMGLYRMKDSVPGEVETLLVNDLLEL